MGEKHFLKRLDDQGLERLRIWIYTVRGEVYDIVIQYETFKDERWNPVVRYDCAHGFFHKDGEKEKQPIEINNLKDALAFAEKNKLNN